MIRSEKREPLIPCQLRNRVHVVYVYDFLSNPKGLRTQIMEF